LQILKLASYFSPSMKKFAIRTALVIGFLTGIFILEQVAQFLSTPREAPPAAAKPIVPMAEGALETVALDCPPLGTVFVRYDFDAKGAGDGHENEEIFKKRWSQLWSAVYAALPQELKGNRASIIQPSISISVPSQPLSANPDWSLVVTTGGGICDVNMKGMTVSSVTRIL
jgi:hypothetical protein